jgi:hypothetical protein
MHKCIWITFIQISLVRNYIHSNIKSTNNINYVLSNIQKRWTTLIIKGINNIRYEYIINVVYCFDVWQYIINVVYCFDVRQYIINVVYCFDVWQYIINVVYCFDVRQYIINVVYCFCVWQYIINTALIMYCLTSKQ